MKKKYHGEIETVLDRLHLQDKLQNKLTPDDFLKITQPVKQNSDTCEKDLASTFLQSLMLLDYRARYIPVRQESPVFSQSNPVPDLDNAGTEDSDLDEFLNSDDDTDAPEQTHVHPMDVQMALFHCSNSFLQQNMITKLSQCQYALPLLVPDPVSMDIICPLWTFRQIRKSWKMTQTKDDTSIITTKMMPICTAETPMVSFLRLGSLSLSKSQLMNTLINNRHDTFFHRDCPGSTKSRHLMDGVAEIAWYCPAGKPTDAFNDCTAFCNLHGDALMLEKQRNILTKKSSVNVVLVRKDDKSSAVISALFKSPKPLICLIVDDNCKTVQKGRGKYKMGLKDRNQADVSGELKRIIRGILSGEHDNFKLETMAEESGIRVDENDKICQEGKSAAEKMVQLLQGMDVSKIKETFLSCQGELWHKWCSTNKKLYRLTGNIEMEKSEKEKELRTIRQKQCEASCSQLMEEFVKSLSSLKSLDKEYFLKWTQILLDALSTDDLSSILQDYDEKWSEVLTLKKQHNKSADLKTKQNELNEISQKLQSATFGLEHIFREMGQIYEAHKSLPNEPMRGKMDCSKYPELAADLFISGHPMELMDGDAGQAPLTWISSLLDAVIKKLGDKRVFVLSVLGIQSSGKSTMLNAMFGLQFAVSAGRCTKGAFMQLVKVSEEKKEHFQFDYILVVDTEGLRALELEGNATLHHDNELATFVVGLGNMTLINIFGENPSDMQDILQIVVQAFMRMKSVKLSPSCIFVHQNVTDISAAEKNMDGKRRLLEKLDQMAGLAAKEEVCDAECFSDIIEFDVQKDVKYFAQLWEGSPPMAPPNPGYSESVQNLKNFILSKASQSKGIPLSEFKGKVQDLWRALLNEKFVFSFKNTLEITVYRKLEVKYGDWTWTLRQKMLTVENKLYTNIENGSRNHVELQDLYDQIRETFTEIMKELTSYFDDDKDKEMLAQWRDRFKKKIEHFHDEQVERVKKKLDEVIQQKKACKKLDEKKTEFENELLQKSKELARQLKDKEKDEEELEKQFNSVWSSWINELTKDTKPIEDINLENDRQYIFHELGFDGCPTEESKSYQEMQNLGNYSKYVCPKHKHRSSEQDKGQVQKVYDYCKDKAAKAFGQDTLPHEEQEEIRSFIDHVKKESLANIKSKPIATKGYSPNYLREVVDDLTKSVTIFQSQKKYVLKKEFTVDLILYVFHRAETFLSESHKKFQKNNDVFTYVDSEKPQYYSIFRSYCKGSSSAVILGELICEKLKSSVTEFVCNKTAVDLASDMKCNLPAFNGNRSDMEKYLLKSLAEKDDFSNFITYIMTPREQVEAFIKQEVNEYIEKKSKAESILKKNVDDIKESLSQDLYDATEKVKDQNGNVNMWEKEFSMLLKDKLTFTFDCQNFSDINDLDFLSKEIKKGLEPIMEEMRHLPLSRMQDFRMKPDEILIEQLCKCCWVTCPFCAAVCTNTLENHEPDKHCVPFHRSIGINGCYYHNTVELSVDFCTTCVSSDQSFYPSYSGKWIPFKEYQTGGPKYANWSISPDESKLTYWKWFVCRFKKELEEHYRMKFKGRGKIPSDWKKYSKEDAFASLDERFKDCK